MLNKQMNQILKIKLQKYIYKIEIIFYYKNNIKKIKFNLKKTKIKFIIIKLKLIT